MNAQEFMQTHADNAVAGKIPDVMKDLTPDALAKVMGLMAGAPNPLTSNKVVAVNEEGDDHIFDVTYFGDGGSVSMRERVRQIDGVWKIADSTVRRRIRKEDTCPALTKQSTAM